MYPEFRKLKLKDGPLFKQAFKDNPPVISEFTFTNLYAWQEVYRLSVSNLSGWLILCSEVKGKRRFFEPIGKGDVRKVMERVLGDFAGTFIRLPEKTKALFEKDSRFTITPDRDNADYLYRADDLIRLSGKKYDGKRNLIKRFKSQNSYEVVGLIPPTLKACHDFIKEWCEVKDCDGVESLRDERQAVGLMSEHFADFGLLGGALKVKGEIKAMAFAEPLNPATLVVHMLKADGRVPGLYQTFMQEFIGREGASFEFINLEQDLGVEGLRKAKLSYQPCAFVNKYTLSQASQKSG